MVHAGAGCSHTEVHGDPGLFQGCASGRERGARGHDIIEQHEETVRWRGLQDAEDAADVRQALLAVEQRLRPGRPRACEKPV